MTENQERILFHTLGYEYKPYWNSSPLGRESRNFYAVSSDCSEIPDLTSLVENGFMEKNEIAPFNNVLYHATKIGEKYVIQEYKKRLNAAPKPTRSQRRYLAYKDISEYYTFQEGFKGFLKWIDSDEDMAKDLKKKWKV